MASERDVLLLAALIRRIDGLAVTPPEPDAAELDRLRAALDRIARMASEAMGREPVHTLAVLSELSRIARAALQPEGSAGT